METIYVLASQYTKESSKSIARLYLVNIAFLLTIWLYLFIIIIITADSWSGGFGDGDERPNEKKLCITKMKKKSTLGIERLHKWKV